MNYKSLEVFITLADKLNYRHTSEIHNMTPSTLSRIIQRLEDEVGEFLLERDSVSVRMTEKGEEFYVFAKSSLESYWNLKNKWNLKDPKSITGNIKIVSGVAAAFDKLPLLLKEFSKAYPNISVFITTGSSRSNINLLKDKKCDFFIQSCGGIPDDEVIRKPLSKWPVVLVCCNGAEKISSLKELNDKPFIASEYPDFSRITKNIFKTHNITPKVVNYVDGHEAICAMVAAGIGYALLPKNVIDFAGLEDKITILNIKETLPDVQTVITMKKQKYISTPKKAFWDFISESL